MTTMVTVADYDHSPVLSTKSDNHKGHYHDEKSDYHEDYHDRKHYYHKESDFRSNGSSKNVNGSNEYTAVPTY